MILTGMVSSGTILCLKIKVAPVSLTMPPQCNTLRPLKSDFLPLHLIWNGEYHDLEAIAK